jgi:periplasmic divalent cation tolerance protein
MALTAREWAVQLAATVLIVAAVHRLAPPTGPPTPSRFSLVVTTCPDAACAEAVAGTLVAEGLAACVTALPGAVSRYHWQGAIVNDTETVLLAKTARALVPRITARIAEIHPYTVPEVISTAIEAPAPGNKYFDWLEQHLPLGREGGG